jgi:hypothetical protein
MLYVLNPRFERRHRISYFGTAVAALAGIGFGIVRAGYLLVLRGKVLCEESGGEGKANNRAKKSNAGHKKSSS